jgi:hypothetical protein
MEKGTVLFYTEIWGHPLKGTCQEKKVFLPKEEYLLSPPSLVLEWAKQINRVIPIFPFAVVSLGL